MAGPTWWQDVAPIVYDNCLNCHYQGGIAPLKLIEYEDRQAGVVHHQDQRAEPHHAAVGGRQRWRLPHLQGRRGWLTEEQIKTIVAWADNGAPEGDPSNKPKVPARPGGLKDVTMTIDPGGEYTPKPQGNKTDDYRCFLIDPKFKQGHVPHGTPGQAGRRTGWCTT